ncbi:MAG: DUF937 domain-containing protein [Acidobacteria bacterium]|nr:MAG: DUF937 domain-containing protein [Acidobacteriota bacterium]
MGLLDDAAKAAGNLTSGMSDDHANMANNLIKMLTTQSGGLGGLVQAFQSKGLGDVVSSWVGTGQNLPISGEQIQSVLGSDTVQQLAAKAGVSPGAAQSALATVLPMVVDRLTPNGSVPEAGGLLSQGLNFLKGKF